ncbi:Cthe_2314 family HEPN domain-containing protein [Pseudomonas sp. MUP55]|uniref:Cthe_2314 family HEPN domain-containing protein n=1 Tax=Pseudomonas sp. MUP55 TaxID=3087234 RepID=UPI002A5A11C7|nr:MULTISPECIES: Cthe_2314 family HEPN domain-containing protein [unclassified Pseudomonas]WPN95162.1 Cthe_2314 family HEPN domain-containing protein [Pseudomonas sp. MUP56]WPO00691.1 Cthe_2314 family HEPN domain-containing protein [Pseudomonas sp. MUP55]
MAKEDGVSFSEEDLAAVLGNAVSHVANEMLVLAQYERLQEGLFPYLWPAIDNGEFDLRMNRVVRHMGGPPEAHLVRKDEIAPLADKYPESSMAEVFDVFKRARKSVIRAHMFMTGSRLLTEQPELLEWPPHPKATVLLTKDAQLAFWEHAEAAYIRLFSFWDRIGQVLDFTFFNIRKFDQNGFNAVMTRIHTNVVKMNKQLEESDSWRRLRTFQTSEKDDGLQFLLQRRNLLVHSLHLHPLKIDEEDVFKSQFNHLHAAHRERLRPRSPEGEVEILTAQLNRTTNLFSDFLNLVQLSPSRTPSLPSKK